MNTRKVIPDEIRQEIRELREKGVSVSEAEKMYSQFNRRTIEHIYYGHDTAQINARREKRDKIKAVHTPQVHFETCLIDGWRVDFNQNRRAGAVKTSTIDDLIKTEGSEKLTKLFKQADQKRKEGKKPVLTNYEMHLRQRAV